MTKHTGTGHPAKNKEFKIAGIKNLMQTDYQVPKHLIDVEAEIDNSLGMAENWFKLKPKVLANSKKYEQPCGGIHACEVDFL